MDHNNNFDLANIFSQFETDGVFASGAPYGSGHINDTFLIKTKDHHPHDYLLQHVNSNVFKNVPELIENIEAVTSHMRRKLAAVPGANPNRETLTLISTKEGKPYFEGNDGLYWRLYIFIGDTHSYDVVTSRALAYQGGKSFGKFLGMLADFPAEQLHYTIPRFHDITLRLEMFDQALSADVSKRAAAVQAEIDFVQQRREEMHKIYNLGQENKIPLRVTHNDTKFNNVLLDEDGQGLCVVDLDTVMPGYVHYDFGDSIRTVANTAAEDETDLSKVSFSLEYFSGYSEGFLSEVGNSLTETEIKNLPFAAKFMPFLIGLRFITDYLVGDVYFKTTHDSHNLERARTQFALVASAEAQMSDIESTIHDILARTTI